MTAVRRYYPGDVLVAATELREGFEAGALNPVQFALALNDLRFRDENGDYWFLDARTTHWYRFDEGEWRPSSTDPKVLEGLASPALEIARAAGGTKPEFEPFFEAEAPQGLTPIKAVEAAVQTTKAAYERGRMSTTEAQRLLTGQYITDEKGRFWTIGVRSGQWYYFEDRQWRKAEQPPALDSLLRVEVGAQPSDALLQAYAAMLQFFLSSADRLPERVTDPWDPPLGFPEPLTEPDVRCASCGARNPPRSLFCNQCGTGLGCPSCGATNPPHHRFCSQCGEALGG
jgi:ribosomal protein L40E